MNKKVLALGVLTFLACASAHAAAPLAPSNSGGPLAPANSGGSSQWTTQTNDIYYTTGKVSIGTNTPISNLTVVGSTSLSVPLPISSGGTCGNGSVRNATSNDTLVIGDCGNLVTIGSTDAITETIPLETSVAFPTLTQINLLNIGTGGATIQAGSTTLRYQSAAVSYVTFSGKYAIATLIKIGADEWKVVGEVY